MAQIYKQIQLEPGATIDEMVKVLNDYNSKNEKVCVEFNGVHFYSDTVTIDNPYLALTGKNKEEFETFKSSEEEKIIERLSD